MTKPVTATTTVRVATPTADYDAVVGTGLIETLGDHVREAVPSATAALLVNDANLPEETKQRARAALAGYRLAEFDLLPTEPDKSIATWQHILEACAAHRLERSDCIIALGGGIVGDTAGFAAASYRRGVNVIQCPTTLLAMVDASVGGKTGVNLSVSSPSGPEVDQLSLLKNFVGAFHHPKRVLADVSTLHPLPPREFAAGLAECIKHSMIAGPYDQPDLGPFLDQNLETITARDENTLTALVAANIRLKATIVATDEHETSTGTAGRALLNLGHTFAHAIETLPGITHNHGTEIRQDLLHGEAVALGLVAAATYAVSTNQLPKPDLDQLLTRLTRANLPTKANGLPEPATILDRMCDDKKAAAGQLRLVVPQANAAATVTRDIDTNAVVTAIEAIRV
ncbi:MAG: 3-dehydroquinate synthase family protein [Planctomycetota bacterium]